MWILPILIGGILADLKVPAKIQFREYSESSPGDEQVPLTFTDINADSYKFEITLPEGLFCFILKKC